MNYNEALEYIHSVMWMGSRPGLSRTVELFERLGNPEKDIKLIGRIMGIKFVKSMFQII